MPILFGIPGGSGSQAIVLDGYPMGKRGEGRRALGASLMAGGLGRKVCRRDRCDLVSGLFEYMLETRWRGVFFD